MQGNIVKNREPEEYPSEPSVQREKTVGVSFFSGFGIRGRSQVSFLREPRIWAVAANGRSRYRADG